jgi:CheY-like chemotaxis protein
MFTPLKILVAEDDLGDVLLLKRAFTKAKLRADVYFVRDGQDVIDYLQGQPPFNEPLECPRPTLLLLDLKMPRVDGFEVLAWIRSQPGFSQLPVVVFSSSPETEDIRHACSLGALSYLVKPNDPNELVHVVERLQEYWVNHETELREIDLDHSRAMVHASLGIAAA